MSHWHRKKSQCNSFPMDHKWNTTHGKKNFLNLSCVQGERECTNRKLFEHVQTLIVNNSNDGTHLFSKHGI